MSCDRRRLHVEEQLKLIRAERRLLQLHPSSREVDLQIARYDVEEAKLEPQLRILDQECQSTLSAKSTEVRHIVPDSSSHHTALPSFTDTHYHYNAAPFAVEGLFDLGSASIPQYDETSTVDRALEVWDDMVDLDIDTSASATGTAILGNSAYSPHMDTSEPAIPATLPSQHLAPAADYNQPRTGRNSHASIGEAGERPTDAFHDFDIESSISDPLCQDISGTTLPSTLMPWSDAHLVAAIPLQNNCNQVARDSFSSWSNSLDSSPGLAPPACNMSCTINDPFIVGPQQSIQLAAECSNLKIRLPSSEATSTTFRKTSRIPEDPIYPTLTGGKTAHETTRATKSHGLQEGGTMLGPPPPLSSTPFSRKRRRVAGDNIPMTSCFDSRPGIKRRRKAMTDADRLETQRIRKERACMLCRIKNIKVSYPTSESIRTDPRTSAPKEAPAKPAKERL